MKSSGERNVYITGIGGMGGTELALEGVSKGYRISGTVHNKVPRVLGGMEERGLVHLDRTNLLNPGSLLRSLKRADPDEIYHLAGHSLDNPKLQFMVYAENLAMVHILLEALAKLPSRRTKTPRRLVVSSSTTVYGAADKFLAKEEVSIPEPDRLSRFYAASKADIELLLENWFDKVNPDVEYAVARKGQHTAPRRVDNVIEHDIAAQVAKLPRDGVGTRVITLRNPFAEVDMMHGRDMARAEYIIGEKAPHMSVVNAVTGVPTRADDLARMMVKSAGFSDRYAATVAVRPAKGDPQPTYARFDNWRLKHLGWKAEFTTAEAVKYFWDWYIQKDQELPYNRPLRLREAWDRFKEIIRDDLETARSSPTVELRHSGKTFAWVKL